MTSLIERFCHAKMGVVLLRPIRYKVGASFKIEFKYVFRMFSTAILSASRKHHHTRNTPYVSLGVKKGLNRSSPFACNGLHEIHPAAAG